MHLDAGRVGFLELAGEHERNQPEEKEVVNRVFAPALAEIQVEVVQPQEQRLVLQLELRNHVRQSVEHVLPVVLELLPRRLACRAGLGERLVVQVKPDLEEVVWVHRSHFRPEGLARLRHARVELWLGPTLQLGALLRGDGCPVFQRMPLGIGPIGLGARESAALG